MMIQYNDNIEYQVQSSEINDQKRKRGILRSEGSGV